MDKTDAKLERYSAYLAEMFQGQKIARIWIDDKMPDKLCVEVIPDEVFYKPFHIDLEEFMEAPSVNLGRCPVCGLRTNGEQFCSPAHSNMWHGRRRQSRKRK